MFIHTHTHETHKYKFRAGKRGEKEKHGGEDELWALPIVSRGYLKLHITQLQGNHCVCMYVHVYVRTCMWGFFGNWKERDRDEWWERSGESEWKWKIEVSGRKWEAENRNEVNGKEWRKCSQRTNKGSVQFLKDRVFLSFTATFKYTSRL